MHDWFSKTGQGFGGEYRYTRGAGSDGFLRLYDLREHEASYLNSAGAPVVTPARTSYEVRGTMSQRINKALRARGRVDYFSSLQVQQTYHMNVYDASRTQRSYNGSLTAQPEGVHDPRQRRPQRILLRLDELQPAGRRRRASRSTKGEKPLFGSPIYFGVNSEYNNLVVERKSGTTVVDQSLMRYDVTPRIRVPFTKWQFLTVNSTAAFRYTYWTESKNAQGVQVQEGISRHYYDLQSNVTGPVFNRIWSFKDKQVRGEDQALDRAVFQRPAHLRGRQLQQHRPARFGGPDRRAAPRGSATVWPTVSSGSRPEGVHARSAPSRSARPTTPTHAHPCTTSTTGRTTARHRASSRRCRSPSARSRPTGSPPTSALNTTRASARSGRWQRTARVQSGTWLQAIARLEPASLYRGPRGLQRQDATGSLPERRDERAVPPEQVRRGLPVQLRHPARSLSAAAHARLLQRAVLRVRRRIPVVTI